MTRNRRTVLITGASSGMGKDFALRLLADGMTVYAAARSVDRMQDLADKGAIVLPMDITRDTDITAVADRIAADGGIDVLINNAGYGQYGSVEDTPIDAARRQFEVNLFGLARLTQLLIPGMRDRKSGLVINISSMGGRMYTPLGAWYHATKHALEGWSDCLRIELEPFGIDVVIIEPGIIGTGFSDALSDNFVVPDGSRYKHLADAIRKATGKTYSAGRMSPPSVITDLVRRAIRADRPRTRYRGGAMGPLLMTLRKHLPDRWFDRILMSQVK